MFTGLVEEVGKLLSIRSADKRIQLEIGAVGIAKKVRTGESIAVNGCCLTVSAQERGELMFDLLQETLDRTNLKSPQPQSPVNLERALAADGRIGGHFVQGHVDCVSPIVGFERAGADFRLEIKLPSKFSQYVVSKGSIAVNGISLTVADVLPKSFVVWIIPYTKRHTNLSEAKLGDLVNLEFDILAKYVERMLGTNKRRKGND
jgi:riboflavin synthase